MGRIKVSHKQLGPEGLVRRGNIARTVLSALVKGAVLEAKLLLGLCAAAHDCLIRPDRLLECGLVDWRQARLKLLVARARP